MKILAYAVAFLVLSMCLGGRERSIRGGWGFLTGAAAGLLFATGCVWFDAFIDSTTQADLAGFGQAFHAINWLAVGFGTIGLGIVGATCGFFLQGEPSRSVDAFYTLGTIWDALTFWWH